MQTDNKILDDLARLGQGAFGALHGMKEEVENLVRQRMESMLVDMDLVTREEYEVVRDMAAAAREENAELSAKITELEAQVAKLQKAPAKKPATPKPAAKKTAPKTAGKTAK